MSFQMNYNQNIHKGENNLCELKIIDAQKELRSPSNLFIAKKVKVKGKK
jgi:hypothetical protein